MSFSDQVPEVAKEVLVDVAAGGDGSSGVATQVFFTTSDGQRVGHHNDGPADDGVTNFETHWIQLEGDKSINYRTLNAASVQIDLLGWR